VFLKYSDYSVMSATPVGV